MNSITLASYRVRVLRKGKGGEAPLPEFEEGADLIAFLVDVLKLGTIVETGDNKALRGAAPHVAGMTIDGLAEAGSFGRTSRLVDQSSGETSYSRKTTDIDFVPLYYRFSFEAGINGGIALFQSHNSDSLKGPLASALEKAFSKKFPDFILDFARLLPNDVARFYLESGVIRRVRFIGNRIPSDIASAYGGNPLSEEPGTLELVVKARRHGSVGILNRVSSYLQGQSSMPDILALEEPIFPISDVKVEVAFGGRTRTIALGDLARINPRYDITNELTLDISGHPKFEDIRKVASEIEKALRDGLIPRVARNAR